MLQRCGAGIAPAGSLELLDIPPAVSRLDRMRIGNRVRLTKTTAAPIEVQRGRDAGAIGIEGSGSVERAPGNRFVRS